MEKITIWHNPRCKKSREGLKKVEEIAAEKNLTIDIRKYLDNPPTPEEIKEVIKKMGAKPIEIVRTKESIWKDNFKGKTLSDEEIIEALHKYPKLIERPIVIYQNKAVLARPADKISELF